MTAVMLPVPRIADFSKANCAGLDTNLFMDWDDHVDARRVCARCPVAPDCYFEAARDNLKGTWGGVFFGKPGKAGVKVDKSRNVMMMKMYRAELCVRMNMTLEDFIVTFGGSFDGLRRALKGQR